MSKLQELIKELCPNGVEFSKLGEVCIDITTGKLNANAMDKNGKYPFFTCDAQPYWINEYAFDKEAILVSGNGSQVGHINYYNGRFNAYQRTYILSGFISSINVFFLFYYLKCYFKQYIILNCRNGSVPYITLPILYNFEIPIPPLEVQNEIVRILDTFTSHAAELQANLQAELQARKEQYEYYRNKLFTFDENDEEVKWMRMEEVGTFIRGKRFVRTDIVEKGIPCIHYGDMYTYYGLSANKTKGMLRSDLASKMRYAQKNDVVIVAAGENKDDIGVGLAWLGDEPAAVHDACFIFQSDMYPLFVSHYLRTDIYHKQIRKYVSEAKICSISAKGLGNAVIPVPSFERQQSIASLLDKFESLVNDLTTGLPAEIAAVQEQYEYYRNKLLTFERKS